jgi:hypothetical protein
VATNSTGAALNAARHGVSYLATSILARTNSTFSNENNECARSVWIRLHACEVARSATVAAMTTRGAASRKAANTDGARCRPGVDIPASSRRRCRALGKDERGQSVSLLPTTPLNFLKFRAGEGLGALRIRFEQEEDLWIVKVIDWGRAA